MRLIDGKAYIFMTLLGFLLNFKFPMIDIEGFMIVFVSALLYVGYAFSINNCFDVDTDGKNPRKKLKNPVLCNELKRTEAIIFSALIMSVGVLTVALTLNREMFLTYLLMILLATVYSVPPRLKSKPFADVISHGVFFGMLPVLFGAFYDHIITTREFYVSLSLFFYSCFLQMRNLLEDYESDAMAGLKTTPTILGINKSVVTGLSAGVWSIIILIKLMTSYYLCIAVLLVSLFCFMKKIKEIDRILDLTMVVLCVSVLLL